MVRVNGVEPVVQITEAQAAAIHELIDPYLNEIANIEQRAAILRGAASKIALAYLHGAGFQGEVHVDLDTRVVTNLQVPV